MIINKEPDPIKYSFSKDLKELIKNLLQKNKEKRPLIDEVLKYPYVVKYIERLK